MFSISLNLIKNSIKLKPIILTIYERLKYSTNTRIKTIEFKTCGELFDKLRENNPKLYRNCPLSGLPVNVEYVDTISHYNNNDKSCKTIVAIHGIPGYHNHFDELIDYFDTEKSNVRVIVPNLPDFSLTRKTMAFWHSNQERSQFIKDFLRALNVTKIDCLISHSAGIHPISMVWTHPQELTIKSIALFCPQPLWLSKYFFYLSKPISRLSQYIIGIKIIDRLKPHIIAHKLGYPMSYANVDEVLLTALISSYTEPEKLHQRLEVIRNKRIPTLIVYGERDKLVLKSNFKQILKDLKAEHLTYLTSDGKVENNLIDKDFIKVLIFRNGGHFAFAKYCDIVNKHVNQLLNYS